MNLHYTKRKKKGIVFQLRTCLLMKTYYVAYSK